MTYRDRLRRTSPHVYRMVTLQTIASGVIKLCGLVIVTGILILLFSMVHSSMTESLYLMTDPGYIAEKLDEPSILRSVFFIAEMIVGVIVMGAIISLITQIVFDVAQVQRLSEIHRTLKSSFHVHKLIATRKLVSSWTPRPEARSLSLPLIDEELGITKEQITQAIEQFGGLRVRYMAHQQTFVVESMHANRSYGTYYMANPNALFCVISTQSHADAGVGHFARTLADVLRANYISNEYYSSGSMVPERQVNYASHERYAKMSAHHDDEHGQFMHDCMEQATDGRIIIYVGTVSATRQHDLHILFGGKKGMTDIVPQAHVDDQALLLNMVAQLQSVLATLDLTVTTHAEVGNSAADHLTSALRSATGCNVVNMQINTRVLWNASDVTYFTFIDAIARQLTRTFQLPSVESDTPMTTIP